MKLCSIASGSSGNCIYIGTDTTHVLVDVGVSMKKTDIGLATIDLSLRDIDGIFITHEHIDHIGGLGVISRKHKIPIYATKKTIEAISKVKSLGTVDPSLFQPILADEKFKIKDLTIHPMKISHDAADPVAYRFYYGSKKVAVVTDLGCYNEYTIASLQGMNALLLEANHDVNMLQVGPYPYPLKRRILGDRGHLSNELSGRLLDALMHENLKAVMLGHLSQENNLAELAYETVRNEINMGKSGFQAKDIELSVAKRSEASAPIAV